MHGTKKPEPTAAPVGTVAELLGVATLGDRRNPFNDQNIGGTILRTEIVLLLLIEVSVCAYMRWGNL